MCYKIRREIEDLFPPKTTSSERLLGLAIADRARRTTRIAIIEQPVLISRTGLQVDGIRKALEKLTRRGLEFRRILGYDGSGAPYYTQRGVKLEYRVPDIDEFQTAWITAGAPMLMLPDAPWGADP